MTSACHSSCWPTTCVTVPPHDGPAPGAALAISATSRPPGGTVRTPRRDEAIRRRRHGQRRVAAEEIDAGHRPPLVHAQPVGRIGRDARRIEHAGRRESVADAPAHAAACRLRRPSSPSPTRARILHARAPARRRRSRPDIASPPASFRRPPVVPRSRSGRDEQAAVRPAVRSGRHQRARAVHLVRGRFRRHLRAVGRRSTGPSPARRPRASQPRQTRIVVVRMRV